MSTNRFSLMKRVLPAVLLAVAAVCSAHAGEADINLPDLKAATFHVLGQSLSGMTLMYIGLVICALGGAYGLFQYIQTKNLPVHGAMRDVSALIY